MASEQKGKNVAQFNDKEKSKINVAVKEAKSLSAKASLSQHDFVMIFGGLRNEQQRPIMLNKKHSYKGEFAANPPETMPGNGSGAFANQGTATHGDLQVVVGPKAAMIYGHYDKLPNQLGWLLAYEKPEDTNAPNKVYVEAGSLSRLLSMDWNEIEQKLDASNAISRYWDSETGAAAVAEIQDQGAKLAFVGANFEIRE